MTSRREPTAAAAEPASHRARWARAPRGLEIAAVGLVPAAVVTCAWALSHAGSTSLDSVAQALTVGSVGALSAVMGGWLARRREERRIALLTAWAEKVVDDGETRRSLPSDFLPHEDLGRLAASVTALRDRSRAAATRTRAAARATRKAEETAEELRVQRRRREAELRHLLDHVPVGVLTIDAEGRVGPDWSLTAECLLGTPDPDTKLAAHLSTVDPTFARRFELGWEQVTEGVLPVELALDQLPKQLEVGQHHFRTSFIPMNTTGGAGRFLVVIEETTEALQRRSEEEANLEFAASLTRFLRDREAFEEFLAEAEELATCVVASDTLDARLRQSLHTLKGNALMMGLEPLAHHCHVLESLIAATGDLPTIEARERLRDRVQRLSAVYGVMDAKTAGRVDIRRDDLDALFDAVQRSAPHAEILRRALDLLHEPVSIRFERLADHTASLAARLGREAPVCTVLGGSVRMDRRRYGHLWAVLGHVARNALTHGIESPDERARDGKSTRGSIVFAAQASDSEIVIEVSDDGRGIDWVAVGDKARALGLPSTTEADLVAALFADGLSTTASANEIAGRGVGLGAVRAAVIDLGGVISVTSRPRLGTCFRFAFPRKAPSLVEGARPRRRATPSPTRVSGAIG